MTAAWTAHRLPIVVPPLPGEAVDSWIASYAARLRVSTRDFLNALGLTGSRPAQMVTCLTPAERHALAAATGLNAAQLTAMTLEPFDGLAVTLGRGSRELRRPPCWRRSGGSRSGAGSRYCPECLRQNAHRWLLEWRLPWIYVCSQHRCLLLEVCPACGNPPLPHGPSYRGPATPGLCSRPVPAAAHGSTLLRCRHRLADTSVPDPRPIPNGPILAGQQHVRALLQSGVSDPEPAALALR
ncbi:TniQ family protein [Streptomyces sp. NPDC007205]|uniref:TniQ family protein n=1 Tax=Streptomyces sp. NPDC007205 TaxID=3154316 RepID=UPI00340BA0B5